ncbi:MAG: hypothetical protein ACTHLT_00640 [Devosia sp.]
MTSIAQNLDDAGAALQVSLNPVLGYEPTPEELRVVAQGALDLHWTDSTTAEHATLVQALASDEATAQELHCLLLLACGAAGVARRASAWLANRFPADAVVEVTRILPRGGRASMHGRFGDPDEAMALSAFIGKSWGLANLYYGVNPREQRMLGTSRVASANDIASRHQVVFDHDGAPSNQRGRQDWEQKVLARHPRELIAEVVRSGNGLQVIYDIEPEAGNAAVRAQARALEQLYRSAGSDPTVHNADRVFRLPYTLNIPNASKLRRGCTLALATLHPEFNFA